MHDALTESLRASPVVMKNGYPYFIHPLTDGVPAMDPKVLREIVEWMESAGDFDCDIILAPESMGIPLAVPLSLDLGIPYSVVRKKRYGLPGEAVFEQKTGYSDCTMTVNGVRKGDRVVIVDDVISTGGTMTKLIQTLRKDIGAVIVDVLVPINKNRGRDIIRENTGIEVKTMVEVSIVDGKVECKTC